MSHCLKRAAKDQKDRQRALDKLHSKLQRSDHPAAFVNNYGYKKFIRLEGDVSFELDEDKIEQARKWDGLHGVITGCPKSWDFRPTLTHAHIAISFMALMCVRHLGYRARMQYKPLSPEVVRNALLRAQYGIVKDQRSAQRYAIPMQLSQVAKKLYRMIGVERSSVPFDNSSSDMD